VAASTPRPEQTPSQPVEIETAALRQSLALLQQQLQDERREAALRIGVLEQERNHLRAAHTSMQDQLDSLQKQLAAARSSQQELRSQQEQRRAEQERTRLLVEQYFRELEQVRRRAIEERGEAQERIRELESLAASTVQTGASLPEESPAVASQASAEPLKELNQQATGPLTVLLATAELMSMDARLDAETRSSAEEIRRQGQQLLEILRSFAFSPNPLQR
jgi:chromosome segregation ATPase